MDTHRILNDTEPMADEKTVMAVIRAARPTFKNNNDKLAFAVHASFLASGFVLIATGPSASSDDAFCSSLLEEVGIENWNAMEDEYAFVYNDSENEEKRVLVKCLVMDDHMMVDALPQGATEPLHCEMDVKECVAENGGENYSSHYKKMNKIVQELNDNIFSRLRSSAKVDSKGSSQSRLNADSSRHGETPIQEADPSLLIGPHVHPSGVVIPPIYPARGGDLFPGPGAGMFPSRGGFGGDMLLGPNDPRWGSVADPSFGGSSAGVPPGARFDPYGPPGVPGFEPNRFLRGRRRSGERFHPDLQRPNPDQDFM